MYKVSGFSQTWNRRLSALVVACLLFVFAASAQQDSARTDNVVIFDSPDYIMFRWEGDTLDTYWLSDFFLYMGKTADSLQANAMERSVVVFLRQKPTEVATVNASLEESLFLSLTDYASFLRLQEKRHTIIETTSDE